MTQVRLDNLSTSTTLESNKSHEGNPRHNRGNPCSYHTCSRRPHGGSSSTSLAHRHDPGAVGLYRGRRGPSERAACVGAAVVDTEGIAVTGASSGKTPTKQSKQIL